MSSQLSLEDFLQKEPGLDVAPSVVTPGEKASKSSNKSVKNNSQGSTFSDTKVESTSNVEVNPEFSSEESAEPHEEEQKIYSISEINKAIKNQLEGEFPIVWLKGEISNFKPHSSGHFYFSLKDEKSQINAVMFKGFNRSVKFKAHDGMEVIVRGRVSVYEPRGTYSINCEVMEPVGLGALQLAYEQLKEKLSKEGLFDPQKKKPLPSLAQRVAIVTSPTGAAIRDMVNVLARRMKNLEITIFPCAVQGDKAPLEIVAAIELANKVGNFDVMIVGRGGGSIEDLWAFNDESVARAIYKSKMPTVSAVGHEIDFTIADFVADLRAPTPSAAAELISKNTVELVEKISAHFKSLRLCFNKSIELKRQKLLTAQRRLVDPKRKLTDLMIRCDDLSERLNKSVQKYFENQNLKLKLMSSKLVSPQKHIAMAMQKLTHTNSRLNFLFQKLFLAKKENFSKAIAILDSLSPLKVLDRGYSIVKNKKDNVIKSSQKLSVGEDIKVRLHEGELEAKITKIVSKQ